jgi:hypothetical protein
VFGIADHRRAGDAGELPHAVDHVGIARQAGIRQAQLRGYGAIARHVQGVGPCGRPSWPRSSRTHRAPTARAFPAGAQPGGHGAQWLFLMTNTEAVAGTILIFLRDDNPLDDFKCARVSTLSAG